MSDMPNAVQLEQSMGKGGAAKATSTMLSELRDEERRGRLTRDAQIEENCMVAAPFEVEAFGFKVVAIDGHDFDQIEAALNTARQTKGQPTAIVMKTVKGKDVSFMENQAGWHGKAPNDAEYEQAMSELKAILAELEGK